MAYQSVLQEARDLAELMRAKLKLGITPIKDIFSLLEDQGIFVVRMPIEGASLSGAFYYDKADDSAKILINSSRPYTHQIFTAAHEFCHYLLDKDQQMILEEDDGIKSPIEKRADAFAANFLMPEEGVRFYISKTLQREKKLSDDDLVKIQQEFQVSWTALIHRLHNLGYAFDESYQEKLTHTNILTWKALQSGTYIESLVSNGQYSLPSDFNRLAYQAYFDDKISIGRLSELLRKSQEETFDIINEMKKAYA